MEKNQAFWAWAEKEVYAANLNWSKVERLAGLSNGAISRRARYQEDPTEETCTAIALALKLPKSIVFQKAGKIEPDGDMSRNKEMLKYFANLSPMHQQNVIEHAKGLYLMERSALYQVNQDEAKHSEDSTQEHP